MSFGTVVNGPTHLLLAVIFAQLLVLSQGNICPIAQGFQEGSRLQPSDLVPNNRFGDWVQLVEGSNTHRLFVGAPGNQNDSGAVYVWDINGTTTTFVEKITNPRRAGGDEFGLAFSAINPNEVMISAPGEMNALNRTHVYYFKYDNGSFGLNQTLVFEERVGESIVFHDPLLVAIGAPRSEGNIGVVYIFRRPNDSVPFAQTQKLELSSQSRGMFGSALAMSKSDYLTLAVGAPLYQGIGTVFIYEQLPGPLRNFEPFNTIYNPTFQPGEEFGCALAMNGTTMAVGTKRRSGSQFGGVDVFSVSSGRWGRTQGLTASDASANSLYGRSVSLGCDTLVVGATGANGNVGQAYVYSRQGGQGTFANEIVIGPSSGIIGNNSFGDSSSVLTVMNTTIIAISGLTATREKNGSNPNTREGAVYLFESKPPTPKPTSSPSATPTLQPTKVPSQQPSSAPSKTPSQTPTQVPSRSPTSNPSNMPTKSPSREPTQSPTSKPSANPSTTPTLQPSQVPSQQPSQPPTKTPSQMPTQDPTVKANTTATSFPSSGPSSDPTQQPTRAPSTSPLTSNPTTTRPTNMPTRRLTRMTTRRPTMRPTDGECDFLIRLIRYMPRRWRLECRYQMKNVVCKNRGQGSCTKRSKYTKKDYFWKYYSYYNYNQYYYDYLNWVNGLCDPDSETGFLCHCDTPYYRHRLKRKTRMCWYY